MNTSKVQLEFNVILNEIPGVEKVKASMAVVREVGSVLRYAYDLITVDMRVVGVGNDRPTVWIDYEIEHSVALQITCNYLQLEGVLRLILDSSLELAHGLRASDSPTAQMQITISVNAEPAMPQSALAAA